MASASASASASTPLPEGAIDATEFNPSSLDPKTHLFFDDDRKYIDPVQEKMNKDGISLACVYCRPPAAIVLHAHNTGRAVTEITIPNRFREMKQLGTPVGAFRDFLGDHMEKEIGTGFTSAMISRLIDFETSLRAAESKRRLYFFDFDRTLTFVPGMSFAFLPKKLKTRTTPPITEIPEPERVLLSQYAKYLFSDYCGQEPEPSRGMGRMSLLRELFTLIGNERIYIVTANSSAKNVPENPYYIYFKFLISELLPGFLEDHIIGIHSTNKPPLFNSKQQAIASILQRSPGSPRSPRSPGGTAATKKSPRSPRSPRSLRSPRSPGGTAATKKSLSSRRGGGGGSKSRRIRRSTRKRRN
jgi:hypothetical protein